MKTINDNDRVVTNDPTFNDEPTAFGPLLGILAVVVLGAILWAVFGANDDNDVVIAPDNQIVDDTITAGLVDTDNLLIRDLETARDNDITVVLGSTITARDAMVTEVISDRLFRIAETDSTGEGILMYLDDSLDLDAAESRVDVNEGDMITVTGTFTNDLSNQTLEDDDSNTVQVDGAVLLVTNIDFMQTDNEDTDN